MANYKTVYKCRECGATSYQQVIDRAQDGSLKSTGQYKCTGCRNVFASIRAWWEPRRKLDFQASKFSNAAIANAAGAGGSLSA
jgi:DNA-directed RNA polymerase subunit RPC12/RpoP